MRSTSKRWQKGWLLALGAAMLLFVAVPAAHAQNGEGGQDELRSPDECASCHPEAYESWSTTVHATTSTRPEFIAAWAEADRPAYCRQCHGTGYDPKTGEFAFEDVTCQSCHQEVGGQPHPGGDMSVDTSAELCGTCHSGVHSPTYEEWLMSDHGKMNIACQTCHEPHDDGLRADDANELCGRCHQESSDNSIHSIAGMECSFCHLYGAQELRGPGEEQQGTGHTFSIAPDVCASCHGMTHTLTVGEVAEASGQDPDSFAESETLDEPGTNAEELESRIADLEQRSRDNLDLGLAGGGLGGVLLGGAVVWFVRREKAE